MSGAPVVKSRGEKDWFANSEASVETTSRFLRRPAHVAALGFLWLTCTAIWGSTIAHAGPNRSLQEIARALDSAATKMTPGARPFRFDVYFTSDKLLAGATQPPVFTVAGRFENPSNDLYYMIPTWADDHVSLVAGVDTTDPFHPSEGCGGNAPAGISGSPPLAEPLADHPPLSEWYIDFPQVFHALRKNSGSFTNGVNSLIVTTARRLRREDTRQAGCEIQTYNENRDYRLLDGVDDLRAVMEIDEAPRTFGKPNMAGSCAAGNYLILDAGTGATIERGSYERCSFYPA